MRPKSLILLALALGSGLVAAIGINQVLANRNQVVVQNGETTPIFVALTDIEYGDELGPQNVKLEQWPKDKVPEGAIFELEQIEGRKTRTKIYADEPIIELKLLSKDASTQGATALIPPGFRVVSVKVDAVSGGSALILPNDRVDVLVHLLANPARQILTTTTKTILQDVRVFAVDSKYRLNPDDPDSTSPAKTISLLVKPDQAELLTLASELGNIRLVMRSPEDDNVDLTDGAQIDELLGLAQHGERDEESLMEEEPETDDSLLSLLDAGSETVAEPETATPTAASSWTMVVLTGQDARRVDFNEKGDPMTSAPLTSGPGQASSDSFNAVDADDLGLGDDTDDGQPETDQDEELDEDDIE